jgi:hypothetical protein
MGRYFHRDADHRSAPHPKLRPKKEGWVGKSWRKTIMIVSYSSCQLEPAFRLRMRIVARRKSCPNRVMRLQRHGKAPL